MVKKDILNPNPFAKSVIAKTGNESRKDIHLAVGQALDKWETCETRFSTLYIRLAKPEGGHQQIFRSFGIVMAPVMRRAMIESACDAYFHTAAGEKIEKLYPLHHATGQKVRAEIKHLLNLYQDAAARRNEIAHGSTRRTDGWFLTPGIFATKKTIRSWAEVKFRYSASDIDLFGDCVEELGLRALNIGSTVGHFHKSLPKEFRESLA